MGKMPVFTQKDPTDAQLVSILDQNYGDGVVHIPENTPWRLFTFAQKLGYINDQGYVTEKGRDLLLQFGKVA